MAYVQKYFDEFHEAIRLSDITENEELREKRDIILRKLNKKKNDNELPNFDHFNQGSYAMGTGVKPINGEYDIDVGIRFDISKDDYPDPVEVKKWVYDALQGHTSEVKMRRSCVTVKYFEDGEPEFHVDLAIYAANNDDGKLYLAKGKLYSDDDNKYWEVSNPLELIEKVRDKYKDDDGKQFRRVIRYLKRWKDVNFSTEGNEAPTGIGLTIAAYDLFTVSKQLDFATGKYRYDDLIALKNLVRKMLDRFEWEYNQEEGKCIERLHIYLPTEPYNDLFEKMSNNQMENFKKKLEELEAALNEAEFEPDTYRACEILNKIFGADFPVPPKDETGQKRKLAFFGTSASA